MLTCSRCDGRRTTHAFIDGPTGGRFDPAFPCSLCHGTGEVTEQTAEWLAVGTAHRLDRVARQISIMACARKIGVTPAELSSMEHGRTDPALLARDPDAARIGAAMKEVGG